MNNTFAYRVAGLAALFFISASVVQADERVESYDFASGQHLKVDLDNGGSVSVQGWDSSGIEVTFNDSRRKLDEYKIEVGETANGLRIHSSRIERNGGSNLKVALKVPRNLSIEFDSAGGSITMTDVAGMFTGRTGGGSITLKRLTGEVQLRTGGGRIEVADSTLDGALRTGGGKVLIRDVVGNLQARSGGGNVVYKNVRTTTGDMRTPKGLAGKEVDSDTVLIKSQGGRINVDAAPTGARVETGGGSITVHNAERFVEAKTGGGAIKLHLVQGWVRARSGAGDIDVTVLRDIAGEGDIELHTGKGDVTLTLPADFSMNVEIDLSVTKNAHGNFDITSDFPLDIERSDEWDYSQGTPRKHIRAASAGGLHQLKISTTNGNVVIRRAGS